MSKIRLKIDAAKDEWLELERPAGTSLVDLEAEFRDKLPYRVLLAKVNNRYQEMWQQLDADSTVEFYDIRCICGEKVYQYSLMMIYLKAVRDVLGDVNVTIENSLNQGFFSAIKGDTVITQSELEAVVSRMREIIDADMPFERKFCKREDAINFIRKHEIDEKLRMLEQTDLHEDIEYYQLDDYVNFFFGYMVPSTSYIQIFDLRKYSNGVILRFPNSRCPDSVPEYRDDVKLYEVFSHQKKWRAKAGVRYLADLNEIIRDGRADELIRKNEEMQEEAITEIAEGILSAGKRIILIAGPSSSGKTTFAKRLCAKLAEHGPEPLYLGTDDYFHERQDTPLGPDGQPDFEGLGAIDLELFNRDMNALLSGEKVDIPEFDFVEGKKIFGKRIIGVEPDQRIVIEGIHCLNDEMSSEIPAELKYKIYISPLTRLSIDRHNRLSTSDARMLRRMVRDARTRNYSAAKTLAAWPKVRAGEEKNIFPYSNSADAVFNTSVSYETALLKKYAKPLLEAITPDEPEYAEALRMLYFIKYFDVIEDDSALPDNAILREFVGPRK